MNKKKTFTLIAILCFSFLGYSYSQTNNNTVPESQSLTQTESFSLDTVPEFSGEAYYVVNENVPYFTDSDMTTESFEEYSELDSLGRCGVAYANIGQDIMPTEKRESISSVKPTGWQATKYDNVDGKYLYNRCHLIGFQLAGENANEKNLITGTRYLNVNGMLPFENMIADYVKETNNHVLYRVTPIFENDNLIASGVLLEAKSVEDNGEGILFNVYCYNNQPGITINYATGESSLTAQENTADQQTYILNTGTKKFHNTDCENAKNINSANMQEYTGSRENVISMGYEPCKSCNP